MVKSDLCSIFSKILTYFIWQTLHINNRKTTAQKQKANKPLTLENNWNLTESKEQRKDYLTIKTIINGEQSFQLHPANCRLCIWCEHNVKGIRGDTWSWSMCSQLQWRSFSAQSSALCFLHRGDKKWMRLTWCHWSWRWVWAAHWITINLSITS